MLPIDSVSWSYCIVKCMLSPAKLTLLDELIGNVQDKLYMAPYMWLWLQVQTGTPMKAKYLANLPNLKF